MIHYTCDMCGKPLHPDEDIRYVVKIEVCAACESEEAEEGFEDSAEELTDYDPSESEEEEEEVEEDMEYKTLRFDLCSKCHKMYIQDPLFLKGHRSRFFNN